jgi:hypothetical protein
MGRSVTLVRLVGVVFLAGCAHGVEDPLPDPPAPVEKPRVPPQRAPEVSCELSRTVHHKDCTFFLFDCDDGSSAGFARCETLPGAYDPDVVPEPYATR